LFGWSKKDMAYHIRMLLNDVAKHRIPINIPYAHMKKGDNSLPLTISLLHSEVEITQ
jgi:hypothetical protein